MKSKKINWIAVSFGTCMGAGVLFLPTQVGLSGIWAFICAIPIVFIVSYFGQRYIADLVASYPDLENKKINYSDIIKECFGNIGGKILIFLFFLIMFGIVIAYISGFKNDLFSFFHNYFQGSVPKEDSLGFIILVTMIFGILLIFKNQIIMWVMRFKTILIMILLLIFSILLIPYWHIDEIKTFPSGIALLRGMLTVIPIMITGTSFFGSVSEMVVDFKYDKKYEKNYAQTTRKIVLNAEVLIFIFIVFFAISSTLALSHSQLVYAADNSQTAMSVLKIPGLSLLARWIGLIILPISFLGVYIAINETLKILFFQSYVKKIVDDKRATNRLERNISLGVIVLIFIILFLKVNVLGLIGLFISPIMCILVFVVPVIIILKMKKLKLKSSPMHMIILILGLILTVSYLLGGII
ncbi:MAG: hypothetical protein NTX05_00215 [Fusobacteria bacterium]|nr:hypothetical protein [Fusobacteriota bacterium]